MQETHCSKHGVFFGIRCPECAADNTPAPKLRHDELAPGVAKAILAAGSPQEAETALATGANAIQVGGDHYKASYQHWDFVADLGLDYWQACATKYVTRWRKKNGLEDLRKAPHYMMKRAELVKAKRIQNVGVDNFPHSKRLDAVFRLAQENGLDALDTQAIYLIAMGRDEEAHGKLEQLIATVTPEAVAE